MYRLYQKLSTTISFDYDYNTSVRKCCDTYHLTLYKDFSWLFITQWCCMGNAKCKWGFGVNVQKQFSLARKIDNSCWKSYYLANITLNAAYQLQNCKKLVGFVRVWRLKDTIENDAKRLMNSDARATFKYKILIKTLQLEKWKGKKIKYSKSVCVHLMFLERFRSKLILSVTIEDVSFSFFVNFQKLEY